MDPKSIVVHALHRKLERVDNYFLHPLKPQLFGVSFRTPEVAQFQIFWRQNLPSLLVTHFSLVVIRFLP